MLAVGLLWFVSTGAIIWLDNLPRRTFPYSMAGAGLLAIVSLFGVIATSGDPSAAAAYWAFACATAICAYTSSVASLSTRPASSRTPQ